MSPTKKYQPYQQNTKCSVENCHNLADYEVYLYDYYPQPVNEEFNEQDFTCPFICQKHMEENEANAVGIRRSRGSVEYPFSNRNHAQGYTTYSPISTAYPLLFDGYPQISIPENRVFIKSVNDELIKYLAGHPEALYNLDPRKFEEIVADIFQSKGYTVQLTPKTRDGGKDIYAIRNDSFNTMLYVIECKRYSASKKVGVEIVRGLYGVSMSERATMGIIATTSTFTPEAIDFASPLQYQLSLRDYNALRTWLVDYTGLKT